MSSLADVSMKLEILITPFHRLFTLDDLAISFPHAEHERVPPGWLFGIAAGVPATVIAIWTLLSKMERHTVHVIYLGFFVSLLVTLLLTDIVKNAVGRPRPDLLARCKPESTAPAHGLVSFKVCTETAHHLLQDGFRSFPSGHSSFSFAGLGYLSLFFAGQMKVYSAGTDPLRGLIAMLPLVGALLIAISRCEDYRHDVFDVCVGSALGFAITYWSYRRYFPSLSGRDSHEPYPHRSIIAVKKRDDPTGANGRFRQARARDSLDSNSDENELRELVTDDLEVGRS